jgi:hypothetical protein
MSKALLQSRFTANFTVVIMIYFANAVDAFHPSRSAVLDTLILMTV